MTEKKPAAMSCFSDKYNRLHRQACFTVELRAAWQVGNGFFRFETNEFRQIARKKENPRELQWTHTTAPVRSSKQFQQGCL